MTAPSVRLTILGAMLGIGLPAGAWVSPVGLGSGAAAAQTVPSSARAGERGCGETKSLRSQHSKEPTRITFVNKSGMYRGLNWIDFKGQQKSYGGLNPGETRTFDTFRTHPWVTTTGPGDCVKIYLPAAEPSTVVLK